MGEKVDGGPTVAPNASGIRARAAREAARARLSGLSLVTAIGWFGFGLQYAAQGRYQTVAIDGAVALATLLIRSWALRDSERRLALGAHLTLAASCLGLFGAALLSGQAGSMAIWWLVGAPLFAGYLLHTRAAVVWAILAAGLTAGVHASESFARVDPEFVPAGSELMLGRIALIFLVLAFALAARRAMGRQVSLIEAQEARAADYAEELEEKTRELERARDAALAAARAKSEFLANMSHEIRTPLNGVLGLLPLLDDADVDREEIVRTMRSSGAALLAIVDDILELSKMESGRLHLHPVRFDVRSVVEDVIQLLKPAAVGKGLDLRAELSPDLPPSVEADAVRIRQVLVNLAGNAVKFTDRGTVCIVARGARDGTLELVVEDTGIGIPEDAREKLFQPFTQLDASATRLYGGTGLGLAISRRLIALMGGELNVESELGRGSTFRVRVPVEPHEEEAPVEAPLSGPVIRVAPSPLRVLVADDDPMNLRVATRLLSKLGHTPDVAQSGREVLAAVDEKPYDVIFMDLHMPDLDGAETTRLIRKRDEEQPLVVALTASVLEEQRKICRDAGMDDFVTKPIQVEMLASVLASAETRRAGRPVHEAN